MEASGNRIEASRVISEAFETYGNYVGPLIGGAAIVIGIAGVINGLCAISGSLFLILLGGIISLVAQVLYTGYVVKLVQDVRDGRLDHGVGELFSAASPYIVTLILNGILYGIAVAIGFFLLIVPGLILITIWAVVAPAIVVEDRGVIEAFGRSRELVKGQGWAVFLTILMAFLIILVVTFLAALIGASIGDAGRVIVQTLANVAVVPIAALVSSILFFDLGGSMSAPTAPAPPAAEPPAPAA